MAEQKEIASIEILHLDEMGYGPEGKQTRREWRKECLENLKEGKEKFEAWQRSWENKAEQKTTEARLDIHVSFADGTSEKINFVSESHSLDFSAQEFSETLNCNSFDFKFQPIFAFARFSGNAYFGESSFSGLLNFRRAIFARNVTFHESIFSDDADFSGATFAAYADFSESTFSGSAIFSESTFLGNAYFSESAFLSDADFRKLVFSGNAVFIESTFSGSVVFRESIISGDAVFRRVSLKNGSDFTKNILLKNVYFENAAFSSVGNFEQSKFQSKIPAFRGCKIDATRLEFSEESHFGWKMASRESIDNISFLKRLADHHGQVDQAIQFNAMELRAKKVLTWEQLFTKNAYGTLSFWLITALYEKLSDYGRSFMRPLIWFVTLFAITWSLAFYAATDHPPVICDVQDQSCIEKQPKLKISAQRAATECTLYRASGLIHFSDKGKELPAINERLFGQPIEPWQMRAWGLFMSFASTVLFFFIALGLRNRYRIK